LVAADPTLIVQLVLNLCTNACQAMQADGGRLSVSLQDADPFHVELTVTDAGHGMDEATKERIFEPFFTTREVGEGSGLGLSVVHGIITTMNATITVNSAPGQGATFCVRMPAMAPIA
jgi:signal transduction histidine kinase